MNCGSNDLVQFKLTRFKYRKFEMLLAAILIVAVTWLIRWRINRSPLYDLAKKIPPLPNASCLPIVGHAHNLLGKTENIMNFFMRANCETDFYHFWLGSRLHLTVNTPEMLQLVLNNSSCLKKQFVYDFLAKCTGFDGLLTTNVELWMAHRKDIQPMFRQSNLNKFVSIFVEKGEICLELLKSKNNCEINMENYIFNYTLDAITETSVGVKTNNQVEGTILTDDIWRGMELTMERIYNIFLYPDFIYTRTKRGKEMQARWERVRKFSEEVFQKGKCLGKRKEDQETGEPFLGHLSELAENGGNWNEAQIFDEVRMFIIAGSDTVATVANFVFTMLAMHQDVQQRVFKEVMEVLGPDRCVTYQDLPKLQYTEKVIKETLRLFPAAPFLGRTVTEDVKIGKYMLPKGIGLMVGSMPIHRSPIIYKDPLKFDPERFSPEEISKRHKYAWIPYSAGPRNCIGLKYGTMSIHVIVAMLVRKFSFHTELKKVEDIALKQAVFISPVEDIHLKIISRI